jgi:hypothetical protein
MKPMKSLLPTQRKYRDMPIRSDRWLSRWLEQFLGLRVPTVPVCPQHDAPFDYLKHVYFEPARDVVVWASRGGGKTRLGAAATLLDLLHKPGVQVRILGGSLEQSRRMWQHLLDDARTLSVALDRDGCDGRHLRLTSGSRAGVLSQSQRSVRGLRVQKLRCDEVEMFDRGVWEAAQMVTRSAGKTRAVRAAGPEAPGGQTVAGTVEVLSTHHQRYGVMREVLENAANRGIKVIKWCVLDVLEKCPPDRPCEGCLLWDECHGIAKTRCDGFFSIDDAIRYKQRLSFDKWKTEMLCERPSTSDCVFPTFDRAVHVLPEGSAAVAGELWLGMDFGFHNPFVCLWIVEGVGDDGGGVVHVVDEYVQPARTVEEHIGIIEGRPCGRVKRIACDPAGGAKNEQTGEANVQLLRRRGYHVHTRGSKIQDGLELIRAALKSGTGIARLFIHARCRKLIDAMEKYHYAPGGSEVPVKDGADHAVDALRYFFVNRHRFETRGGRAY